MHHIISMDNIIPTNMYKWIFWDLFEFEIDWVCFEIDMIIYDMNLLWVDMSLLSDWFQFAFRLSDWSSVCWWFVNTRSRYNWKERKKELNWRNLITMNATGTDVEQQHQRWSTRKCFQQDITQLKTILHN